MVIRDKESFGKDHGSSSAVATMAQPSSASSPGAGTLALIRPVKKSPVVLSVYTVVNGGSSSPNYLCILVTFRWQGLSIHTLFMICMAARPLWKLFIEPVNLLIGRLSFNKIDYNRWAYLAHPKFHLL